MNTLRSLGLHKDPRLDLILKQTKPIHSPMYYLPQFELDIKIPSMSSYSEWSLPFRHPGYNFENISHCSRASYPSRALHLPRLGTPNIVCSKVQIPRPHIT